MANIKFSQFTQKTTLGTVDFLVGYTGAQNIQIDPADLLSDYSQGTGAAGQVTFFSATSTVTGDNDLYWDNTNKRLGIGITSPNTKLEIESTEPTITLGGAALNQFESGRIRFTEKRNSSSGFQGGYIHYDGSANALYLGVHETPDTTVGNDVNAVTILRSNRNVGIGTSSPSAKLDVNGTLIATGISQLGSSGANVYLTSSSAGNVGIGTSSPSEKLQINNGRLRFLESGQRQYNIGIVSGTSDFAITDATFSSERMRITGGGNVGIGTTAPAAKLDISNGTNSLLTLGEDSGRGVLRLYRNTASAYLQAWHDGTNGSIITTAGSIILSPSSGNVGIGTSSPSYNLVVGDGTTDTESRFYHNDASYTSIRGYGLFMSRVNSYIRPTTDGTQNLFIGADNATWNTIDLDVNVFTIKKDGSSRLRVNSSGNVGIGTTDPLGKLHVSTGNDSNSGNIEFIIGGTNGSNARTGRIIKNTSSPYEMTIRASDFSNGNNLILNDNGGRVGIGTTSPSKKLEVVSNNTYDGIQISGSSIPTLGIIDTTNNAKFVAYVRDSDATIGMETNHPLTINTNNIERMRIDSAGNVGVGTTSPGAKLEVKGATAENTQIRIQTDGGASEVPTLLLRRSSIAYGEIKYIPDGGGNQGVHITDYRTDVSNIIFNTAGTNERMRIDTSGNVGIGTTNPETLAHIKVNGGSAQLTLEREGGGAGKAVLAGAAGGLIVYNDAFATKMYVGTSGSYDGNVGIGTISPQYKLDVDGDVQINETLIAKAGADLILQARSSQIVGINSNGTRTMTLDASNNVGIGTSSPASKLEVDGGDIEVDDSASGLILRSPDGTRYRVTVANGGTLSVSAV